jgi:hypothetical protein
MKEYHSFSSAVEVTALAGAPILYRRVGSAPLSLLFVRTHICFPLLLRSGIGTHSVALFQYGVVLGYLPAYV